jgi:hypothetical protein
MSEFRTMRDAATKWLEQMPPGVFLFIIAGFVSLQAVVLLAMGQPAICACGTVKLWMGDVHSSENSQQFADWYSYTHIVHGVILFLFLWLVARRLPFALRLALAIGLEAGWEVLENTPVVIERYRQLALAQGYIGDSVINSVGDTLAAAFGFILARLLPVWTSTALVIAMELFVGYMIHDNLTLNVIQLIHPNGAISRWQSGG